ncbi:hypothetical protein OPV22_023040 [Ensete ventricosum]|uniref:Uncharacterized protein n=1 Tax=Ensete ventricosum TaxID=4639 RepID=A0AAV8QPS6_ENSVE|nr:hypothetical protein OPV22_023040 [Ensete ventricosum]
MASIQHLLRPAVGKGTGVLTSADEGKGIVVEEEEGDKEADDDDIDDGSYVGSDDASGGEGDDDSDFVDDPFVEAKRSWDWVQRVAVLKNELIVYKSIIPSYNFVKLMRRNIEVG